MTASTVLTTLTIVFMVSREAFASCETRSPFYVPPVTCPKGSCTKLIKYRDDELVSFQRKCFTNRNITESRCKVVGKKHHQVEICFCDKSKCYRTENSAWKSPAIFPLLVMSIFATF